VLKVKLLSVPKRTRARYEQWALKFLSSCRIYSRVFRHRNRVNALASSRDSNCESSRSQPIRPHPGPNQQHWPNHEYGKACRNPLRITPNPAQNELHRQSCPPGPKDWNERRQPGTQDNSTTDSDIAETLVLGRTGTAPADINRGE
jgi:hypothetical protein